MIRALWLKIWKGRSKGISSVIGTVFLILIIFAISTNVFLWTISQNATYNQAVNDTNQKNADRMNENVVATQGNYTVVSANRVRVEAKLTNAGSLAAQLVNLWVFDTSKQNYNFNNSIASSNLNPGQELDLTGVNGIVVTISGAGSLDTYNAWFVTARGNNVPVTQTLAIIVAQVSQGIGSVAMDFGSFVYYHVDSSPYRLRQTEWPNGLDGFTVPNSGTNIAFRISLTNYDSKKQTITFNAHTCFWLIFPVTQQQVRSAWWYICNVNPSTGVISSSYSTVTMSYGQQTYVYFGSSNDLTSQTFQPSGSGYNGPSAANLMLLGTIGTNNYGQNIPFVAIYVT